MHTAGGLVQEGLTAPWVPASAYQFDSCQLLSEIQAHLLETTIDGGLTWSLWTAEEVLGYFNERVSRFLLETGLLRTRANISLVVGQALYDLPSDLISLRRLAVGTTSLLPLSKWELDNGYPGWQSETPATPTRYAIWPEHSLTVRVVPVPDAAGTMVAHYVPNAPTITSVCVPVPIPGTFAPGIKYGVMADMLSKQGEANDPQRAAAFEARYAEAIDLAKALVGEAPQ